MEALVDRPRECEAKCPATTGSTSSAPICSRWSATLKPRWPTNRGAASQTINLPGRHYLARQIGAGP